MSIPDRVNPYEPIRVSTDVPVNDLVEDLKEPALYALLDAIINNGRLTIGDIRAFVNQRSYDDPE